MVKFVKSQKKQLILNVLSILLLGFLVAFALITYISKSFGWFSKNEGANVTGSSVTVGLHNVDATFEYFQYNVNTEIYVSSNDLSDIDFNPYDLVFRARNRYTPVVVRVAVDVEDNNLPDSGTLTVTIARDTTKPATVLNEPTKMSMFGSSIMRFTPFIGSSYYSSVNETQFKNIDTDAHFNAVRSLTGNDPTSGSKVFTTFDEDDNVVKADSVSLTYSYTQSDLNGDILYLYVYITYDEGYNSGTGLYSGLSAIYATTSGLTSIGDEAVTFENDLDAIRVSVS